MNYLEISKYMECDINEMSSWLFEYGCRYLERQGKKVTGIQVKKRMDIKFKDILSFAREYTEGCDGIDAKVDFYWDKLDSTIIADMQKERKMLNR